MAVKCYNKPNRTKNRPFTVRDIRRISKKIEDSGIPWMKVMAWSAVGMGVGWFMCEAAKSLKRVLRLTNILRQIAVVAASATAIRVLIEFLKGGAILKIPIINRFAVILIVILLLLQKIIDLLGNLADDLVFVDEFIDKLDSVCGYVHEAVGDIVKEGKEDELSVKDRLLAL